MPFKTGNPSTCGAHVDSLLCCRFLSLTFCLYITGSKSRPPSGRWTPIWCPSSDFGLGERIARVILLTAFLLFLLLGFPSFCFECSSLSMYSLIHASLPLHFAAFVCSYAPKDPLLCSNRYYCSHASDNETLPNITFVRGKE